VVATALAVAPSDPLGGWLWAFKARAKDGSIEFSPDTVQVTPLEITDLPCTLSDAPLTVTATQTT